MVRGDVLGDSQLGEIRKREVNRVVDQAAHLQPVVLKSSLGQLLPIFTHRHQAVRPESRRDVFLRIVLTRREAIQGHQRQRVRNGLLDML
jgi:hypothetical protein